MDYKDADEMTQQPEQAGFAPRDPELRKQGMAAPAFLYGLLTAIALFAITLFIYFTGMSTEKWPTYLSYFVLLAGIVIGLKNYRDEARGGFISYGSALGFGTFSMFFAALIVAILSFVFYKFLAPDAMIPIREAAELQMLERNPNMSDQEYDMAMKFISPGFITVTLLFSYTFIGFVLSLLVAAVMKKSDPLER